MAAMARLNKIWRCNTISSLVSSNSTDLLLPPSSSVAVKHGPCLLALKKDPGFRNQVPEETSLHLLLGAQDQRLGAEQDQLLCGSTGTSPGNCQETETCLFRACHTPRQPLQNHPSRQLEGRRRRGRHSKCWMDSIKEWTSLPELLKRASCRKDWKRISAESSLVSPPPPSPPTPPPTHTHTHTPTT